MPGGFYEAKERRNGQNADTHPGMSGTFKRGTRSHSSHHQSIWLSAVIHSLVLSLSLISHNDAWRPPVRNDVSTVQCVPVDLIEVTRSTQPIICSPDEIIHAACGFSPVWWRFLFLTAWINPFSRCLRWWVGGNQRCGRANLDTWIDCSFNQVWNGRSCPSGTFMLATKGAGWTAGPDKCCKWLNQRGWTDWSAVCSNTSNWNSSGRI